MRIMVEGIESLKEGWERKKVRGVDGRSKEALGGEIYGNGGRNSERGGEWRSYKYFNELALRRGTQKVDVSPARRGSRSPMSRGTWLGTGGEATKFGPPLVASRLGRRDVTLLSAELATLALPE